MRLFPRWKRRMDRRVVITSYSVGNHRGRSWREAPWRQKLGAGSMMAAGVRQILERSGL
jgi:hypothetical protein